MIKNINSFVFIENNINVNFDKLFIICFYVYIIFKKIMFYNVNCIQLIKILLKKYYNYMYINC